MFIVAGCLLIDSGSAYWRLYLDIQLDKPAYGPFVHYRLHTTLTRNGTKFPLISAPGVSDFGIIGRSRCVRRCLISWNCFGGWPPLRRVLVGAEGISVYLCAARLTPSPTFVEGSGEG